MKKLLLGIAALSMAVAANATNYKVFDIANPGTWTPQGTGFTQTSTVGGQTFTITTDKGASTTDLLSPDNNKYAWRVYKNSNFTINASFPMKQIVITYSEPVSGKDYAAELTLDPSSWTGSLNDLVYTITNTAGSDTFKGTAASMQVRIVTIEVSDEIGNVQPPVGPDNLVYENTFETTLDGWTKINDESLSDFSGWKINNSSTAPKCAICNSYYSSANHAADARMQKEFDLTNRTGCVLTVEQAFGYDFPTSQVENYTMYIISGGNTQTLAFSNFPEVPPTTSNWSKSFAENTFDISEFDGETITVGFRYLTDGSVSRAWELKNFKITGDLVGAVNGVAVDESAPVYYTIQGVRVENPEKGLYIVVKGNKAQKVIL